MRGCLGRRRALDRAMDAALKNPTKRRRKAGEVVRIPIYHAKAGDT